MKKLGRLARFLNPCRRLNPYGGTACAFFLLTNECNYTCDFCYTDSQPGVVDTRFNPQLALKLMAGLQGVDEIVLSGGEPSFLPCFSELLFRASRAAKLVTVFTNGTGFLDFKLLEKSGTSNTIAIIRKSLAEKLSFYPANVEIALPVTEYHLTYDHHPTHRYHEAIIRAAQSLACEWRPRNDRPRIRFIVKNTPSKPNSGKALIRRFGLENLGSTGSRFPGNVFSRGRGVSLSGSIPVPPSSLEFEGTLWFSHRGVYWNDTSFLEDLHSCSTPRGKICTIKQDTTADFLIRQISTFFTVCSFGIPPVK